MDAMRLKNKYNKTIMRARVAAKRLSYDVGQTLVHTKTDENAAETLAL